MSYMIGRLKLSNVFLREPSISFLKNKLLARPANCHQPTSNQTKPIHLFLFLPPPHPTVITEVTYKMQI
jgi:hypothetical protein